MNQMQFAAILQKVYELEANVAGMSTRKNPQFFFKNQKNNEGAKYNKKIFYCRHRSYIPVMFLNHINDFYKILFKKREQKTTAEKRDFLNAIDVPKLSEDQVKLYEEDFNQKRFLQVSEKHAKL